MLGDLFPDVERQSFVERHLTPGRVLYLFCGFTNPPKDKLLVLLYSSLTPLLFVINSRIHPFIQKHPELLKCQVVIRASDYDFLQHDSFIDCSQVIEDFDEAAIKEQALGDVSRVRGELSTDTKLEIIRAVQNAPTISKQNKTRIAAMLAG